MCCIVVSMLMVVSGGFEAPSKTALDQIRHRYKVRGCDGTCLTAYWLGWKLFESMIIYITEC